MITFRGVIHVTPPDAYKSRRFASAGSAKSDKQSTGRSDNYSKSSCRGRLTSCSAALPLDCIMDSAGHEYTRRPTMQRVPTVERTFVKQRREWTRHDTTTSTG
ncbi:hypothetical protein AC1031_015047 [Aphanomyces cochlioides]|nr:hypothetical protein AC1031_015047 [Aphanomyces cochlioides]